MSTPLGWPAMLLVLPRLLQRRSVDAADHVRGSARPRHKLILQRLHKVHVGGSLLRLLLLLLAGTAGVAVAAAGTMRVLHGEGLEMILQVQIVHKVPRRRSHPLLGPATATHGQILIHHPVGGTGSGCRRHQRIWIVVHTSYSATGTVVMLPGGTFGTDRTRYLASVVLRSSPRTTVRRGLVAVVVVVIVVGGDGRGTAEGHRKTVFDVHERVAARLQMSEVGEPVAAGSAVTSGRTRSRTVLAVGLLLVAVRWHASVGWEILVLPDRRWSLVEHVTELVRGGQFAAGCCRLMILRGWNRGEGRCFGI